VKIIWNGRKKVAGSDTRIACPEDMNGSERWADHWLHGMPWKDGRNHRKNKTKKEAKVPYYWVNLKLVIESVDFNTAEYHVGLYILWSK
jgi:hypothetical protein